MANKSVIFFTNPGCGGAERMTLLFMKILRKSGLSVRLAICTTPESDLSILPFVPKDVEYDIIRYPRYRFLIFYVFRYLLSHKSDFLFVSLPLLAAPILILKRFRIIRRKVVLRECNMPDTHPSQVRNTCKSLFGYADAIISQTEEMKEEMVKHYELPEGSITVINNPIDKDLIQAKHMEDTKLASGRVNYMACGRIAPQKDIITLLNAFAIVKQTVSNAMLYIVGKEADNDYMASVNQTIKDNNLYDSVHLVGFQSNPYKYLKHADAFVLSSIYEGLPNVMLEAMYLGKPVAATRCIPYISQVIEEGKNGYTCDINNPADLAEAMVKAIQITDLPLFNDINSSDHKIVELFNSL